MNIETANRLLKLRKEHNLSQEELAAKLNISRQAVSKWERAEAAPDTDNLIVLSRLYNVSLDELLTGVKAEETKAQPTQQTSEGLDEEEEEQKEAAKEWAEEQKEAAKEWKEEQKEAAEEWAEDFREDESQDNSDESEFNYDYEEDYTDPKISFNGGIHIHDNGDKVDISPKGIFVEDKNGTKVDISLKGIYVNDPNSNHEFKNGHIFVNGIEKKGSVLYKFPFYLIALFMFFYFGFACDGWHYSWLSFLTIPLYYSGVSAIINRNLSYFAYPVLTTLVFFLLGFLKGMWHPGWMIFFTIPFYYWIASFCKDRKKSF